jgi:hypothetical protein
VEQQHDGASDAHMWMFEAPTGVVRMVRRAITTDPTPHALRQALRQAEFLTDDELTRAVRERYANREYANAFARALLRRAE